MSALFRKKPIPVEARQVPSRQDGVAGLQLAVWCGGTVSGTYDEPQIFVPTLEGELVARVGDWIVKGPRGEFWPVKGDIFAETYEAVDSEFFQPGRTYAREHHGCRIEFHVRHVDETPNGTRFAFGFRTEPCISGWAPMDTDDMDGWTDVTEGEGQ